MLGEDVKNDQIIFFSKFLNKQQIKLNLSVSGETDCKFRIDRFNEDLQIATKLVCAPLDNPWLYQV